MIFFLLGLWIGVAKAQSLSSIKARVSRLESENYRLRSRVNRLESQLKRVRSPSSSGDGEQIRLPSSPPAPSIQDPMFDRLAILVIELKERMNGLEARMDEIELQEKTFSPSQIE